MELVQHTFSYTNFQYTNTNLYGESINYINKIKNLSGFTSYDETQFNYNEITSAIYDKFPLNQFTTTWGGALSAYTIVQLTNPHNVSVGEYVLLKPLFGDDTLLGLNVIDDVGDAIGGNPDFNVWIHKSYSAQTIGFIITQINEILAFFKGFNIQPTYNSINTYWSYIEAYLDSPDVNSFINIGIGDFFREMPRRVFNELGFEITNYTGGTEDVYINLPIYLTQTIQNIGLYQLPYSGISDNKDILVSTLPESYYIEYGITQQPALISSSINTFSYVLTDGITANTYSDFFETTAINITGTTSEKSIKVRKYDGTGIRYGYRLPSASNTFSFTLERNLVDGVNDGYIEYTTVAPLTSANRSSFSYYSWGRSPQNDIVGNTTRSFISMIHDELHDQLILEPKIKNDVFIDRGVFSPFEKVYKLGTLRTLENIASFERGEFNVIDGEQLDRTYLANG